MLIGVLGEDMFKMCMTVRDIFTVLNYFLIFLFIEFTFCVPFTAQTDSKRVQRADIAFNIIKTKSCLDLISTINCTKLKTRQKSKMHIYMAETNNNEKLDVRPINFDKTDFSGLDGVIVVDPLPEAHYGHALILLLIKSHISSEKCQQSNGIYYKMKGSSTFECMYLPSHLICLLNLRSHRKLLQKRRKLCSINFFPKVYNVADKRRNRLECYSNLNGFGACPVNKNADSKSCVNAGNCNGQFKRDKTECISSCDHAVLISGGWNRFINRQRHYLNMRSMWKYLVKRGYPAENIKIYFANNSTVDFDNRKETKESEPAIESYKILNHISYICTKKSRCVDTLTLYLNGPTFQNGDVLLWDRNRDGHATDSEILKLDDLLQPIATCGVKNVVIIADQNYGGHIISKLLKLRSKNSAYDKVHVITASTKNSLSFNRHFTQGFIDYDNVYIEDNHSLIEARPIKLIYQNLRVKLSKDFKIKYLPGLNINDISITGPSTQKAGCITNIPSLFGKG